MRNWVVGIIAGYAVVLLLLIGIAQYVSRSTARPYEYYKLPASPIEVILYADSPLPFRLGGGPFPGDVKLVDDRGNVLDDYQIGNVFSVRDVQLYPKEEKATFLYLKDGKQRIVTLNADT